MKKSEAMAIMESREAMNIIYKAIDFFLSSSYSEEYFAEDENGYRFDDVENLDMRFEAFNFWVKHLTFENS